MEEVGVEEAAAAHSVGISICISKVSERGVAGLYNYMNIIGYY